MFQYAGGTVDLMALAAQQRPRRRRIDPVVAKLLADVRSSTSPGHGDDDDRPADAVVRVAAADREHDEVPDGPPRLQRHVEAPAHRVRAPTTTWCRTPTRPTACSAIFPGFPVHGMQDSERYTTQLSLRSTLTLEHGERVPRRRRPAARRCSPRTSRPTCSARVVGDMDGYAIAWSAFKSISNPYPGSTQQLARGLDEGHRGHAELAEGQARLTHRRVGDARRRVAEEPAARADDDPRHGHGRPGRRDVQHRRTSPARRAPTSPTPGTSTRC